MESLIRRVYQQVATEGMNLTSIPNALAVTGYRCLCRHKWIARFIEKHSNEASL